MKLFAAALFLSLPMALAKGGNPARGFLALYEQGEKEAIAEYLASGEDTLEQNHDEKNDPSVLSHFYKMARGHGQTRGLGKKKKSSSKCDEDSGIFSAALRYGEGLYIAPGGDPGDCLTSAAQDAMPTVELCDLSNPSQVWNVIRPKNSVLPIYQFQSEETGLCAGVDVDLSSPDCRGSTDVVMLDCADTRTFWMSPSPVYSQSYYCYTINDGVGYGFGWYWSYGGMELDNDDIAASEGTAYFFDKCMIEQIVADYNS